MSGEDATRCTGVGVRSSDVVANHYGSRVRISLLGCHRAVAPIRARELVGRPHPTSRCMVVDVRLLTLSEDSARIRGRPRVTDHRRARRVRPP